MSPETRTRFLVQAAGRALALWTIWLALLPPGWAADRMDDAEKRTRIDSMYRGYKKDFAEVEDIDPQAAMALAKSGAVVFVDVRTAKEQEVSMLPGAVTEEDFLKDPARYRDHTVIGYCTISYRSGVLAAKLRAGGIRVLNLRGGLLAWVHAGGKVFDKSGETRRIHVYGRKWDLGPGAYESVW
jgi:sodium/bile acid cotransporter 7